MKNRIAISIIIAALTFSLVGSVQAERPRLTKPSERSFEIRHTDFMMVPKLTVGMLVGQVADRLRDFNDAYGELILIGGGISLERYLSRRLGFGLSLEALWRIGNGTSISPARLESVSGYGLYRFAPLNRSSLFAKCEIGSMSGQYSWTYGNRSLGRYPFIKIGAGHFFYTGPTNNARFELFYKTALSKGSSLPRSGTEIEFNAACIGFEAAFGLGF